jgi:hypothetical protein
MNDPFRSCFHTNANDTKLVDYIITKSNVLMFSIKWRERGIAHTTGPPEQQGPGGGRASAAKLRGGGLCAINMRSGST